MLLLALLFRKKGSKAGQGTIDNEKSKATVGKPLIPIH